MQKITVIMLLGAFSLPACAAVQAQRLPMPGYADRIIGKAQSMLGSEYVYGGTTRSRGFDCSGFIYRVYYEVAAVRLPRTAQAQFSTLPRVELGEESPSDLIFFYIPERASWHVGIYLGGGQFIHASSGHGEVRVDDANAPYWRDRFQGLRRIL
jgi:cell wall-associated NlpC family hydrolase